MDSPGRRWDVDELGVVGSGLAYVLLGFVPWYESRAGGAQVTLRAWDLGLVTVVGMLLAAYAAGRVVLLHYRPQRPDVPLAPGAEPFAASVLAFVLSVYRIFAVPQVGTVDASRTDYLALATLVVLLQAVFATRVIARTGFRAGP
jgi:cytochrome b561